MVCGTQATRELVLNADCPSYQKHNCFRRGVWCAQAMGELVSLKQQQKDSATYQAALAARAATGAAAANLRKRCNQCEACLTSQVTHCSLYLPSGLCMANADMLACLLACLLACSLACYLTQCHYRCMIYDCHLYCLAAGRITSVVRLGVTQTMSPMIALSMGLSTVTVCTRLRSNV